MQNITKNLIIAVVIVIIIVGLLIFFFGRKNTETGEPTFLGKLFPESEQAPSGNKLGFDEEKPSLEKLGAKEAGALTPTEAKNLPAGTLIHLSLDAVSSIAVNASSTRYHKNVAENPGHLFERLANGSNEEKRISNFTIPQVLKVVWSPDAKKAVIFYNLNNEVRKILVDYTESTPKTNFLPNTTSAVAFSPDSKSMVFINDPPAGGGDTRNVFVANAAFGSQKKILDNIIPNLEILWPAQNLIALKTKSSFALTGFLYTMSANGPPAGGGFSKAVESLGLDVIWNNNASGLIYTNSDLDLFYLDVKTGINKSLGLKTVAEKCVFSKTKNNLVYCAIPKIINDANYPDEWWQGKIAFEDNIIGLDVNTLDFVLFAETLSDVVNPTLSGNDEYLLFRDRNTGELWSLKLK